jgi:RNA polymerase sigma-70 factor (ECF subfamily)
MCRHREDAEDVAQNALMKGAQKIDGFRGEASVRTWLHTIATNECRMLRRKVAPGPFDEALEAALAATQKPVLGQQQSPESLAIEAETRREVVTALDELPERYQQVLVLKDGCGLRAAEVAHVLDTTIPAVRSALFRARRMLRSQLEPLESLD